MVETIQAQNLYLANYINKLEYLLPRLKHKRSKLARKHARTLKHLAKTFNLPK